MAILILPFFLGALISFIMSVIKVYKLIIEQETNPEEFVYGLTLASILYGLIIFTYVWEKQYWALGPLFTFPFFMFIIPFLIALITNQSQNRTLKKLSTLIFISIIFSGLFFIIFNNFAFNILDKIGLEKYY